ncbi:hypothetical protein [Polaromonas sp. JS666]|nr:hypothetical protein [Polaromonas sp. JS666]
MKTIIVLALIAFVSVSAFKSVSVSSAKSHSSRAANIEAALEQAK